MKPGEKEMNTLLRNEASSLFFFKAPIRSRSPLLTGSRLISLPLATQMFQFAKFEKSKERRLATELGYGFPIGDPWITDGISPWPFASESVLPSQCPGIHPMHSFRSYLIEDIALERDTKSLPKIEREAIPVRYWSCGFFLLVDFFLRDTLVRAVNPLRQEMRASQSLELPDANNSLEGEFHRYGIRTARRSSILKFLVYQMQNFKGSQLLSRDGKMGRLNEFRSPEVTSGDLHNSKASKEARITSLSLDPLFFYIPIVDNTQKCLDVDRKLEIVVCVLRSVSDMLYVVHIIIQFRTAYVPRYNHMLGKRILIDDPHYVARRYLTSYFIIDVLAALPLPQFAVLVIIPNLDGDALVTKNTLKFIIFFQNVPRVIRISLFYQKVTKISGFLTEKAWAGAAFNFFLYVLASHVIGAIWYLFAIESELRCWHIACQRHNCHSKYSYCGEARVGDYGFLNTSCPLLERNEIKDSSNFDFGIYLDALQTRVLETTDFCQKILYCSWWGLQSLSSLGQGLKASTFYAEILFADFIIVIGLVLFALLIGNVQSFSNYTLRVEEMKEKKQEAEDLMSHISLPEELRQRVRRHKRYKWKITKGVELDSFVRDLPRDLKRDIKRHLCLLSLKRVPFFKQMDEHLVDAMCDRLKPVLYTENSLLVREGDPVHEIIFITRGKVLSETTDGDRINFYSSIHLEDGDLCGEELLTWSLDPTTPRLPFSTRTVKAVTHVQAFALVSEDLMFVACQFRHLHSTRLQHTFSEAATRKTHILDVVYNASNNELVRTQTLVKSAIVQVDAAPFKEWYLQHYGVDLGRKKKAVASATKKEGDVFSFLLDLVNFVGTIGWEYIMKTSMPRAYTGIKTS
ncbi:cyclic nucleotide-gated ion channel 1-like protein [Tanacetum coccineum]